MPWVWAIICWFCAAAAHAGAWPREAGTVFVAVSANQTRAKLYAEYGVKDDWTLGVEVSMPHEGRNLPDVSGFVHHPIWRGSGGAILSAGLAMEIRETHAASQLPLLDGEAEIVGRAGLFWGKGFETGWGNGWATIDAQVERIITTDWLGVGMAYKLDAAIGLKPSDRVMVMVQAQGWQRGDAKSLRLEAGFGYTLGSATLVLSPSVGVIGSADQRVNLGLWLEF